MYYLSGHMSFLAARMRATKPVHQVLLTGQPGTGKTAFSEWFAQQIGATYLYALCHSWLSDEDFFNVLNVAAIAVGIQETEDAWTPGILRLAAEASHRGAVVLCIDEIDKTSAKAEALLLDFLQSGRVPLPDHRQIQANQANLFVILTSNGQRQLSDALLRRLFRLEVPFLPESVESDLIRKSTGAPMPVIKAVLRLVKLLRGSEIACSPSLPEAQQCVELLSAATSALHCELAVQGTLIRAEEDRKILDKTLGKWPGMLYGLVKQESVDRLVYTSETPALVGGE